ncbi:MAG: phosphoglycerate dehydrogenase [Geminicoccaceae bacterium]
MTKVLIADKLSPRAAEIFRNHGIEVDEKVGLEESALRSIIRDYDGLAVRSATKVTATLLDATDRLRVIGRAGIGVDNIDVEGASARGIVVMNTPFGNSTTTAEHAIAMMFALARQLPAADRSTRAGKWEKSRFMGVELTGKTLGVVGCGNIGSIVALRACALQMKVIAYDPYLSPESATELGIEKVEFDQLLARADIITLHTPLTDGTRNILDGKALAKTKPGVRIVNCARGGLIDESALAESLKSGHVAGAALDVFATEPARESPLFEMENVVVTPHLGAATSDAQENVAVQVAEQMSAYLLTGAVVNALNMPAVTAEEAPKLEPYMRLCRQLGSFAGQLTETGLKGATITFAGAAASLNTKPMVASLLEGLLKPLLTSVNMINAPLIAKERNIDVAVTTRDLVDGYTTLVTLSVETERGTRSVSGTLFQDCEPRIVEIRGIRMDAHLAPRMLYIRNQDKPGFIGALGQEMGRADINIASFHLGRDQPGGDAIALLEIDGDVSPEVIARLRGIPQVVQVKPLSF